MQTPLTAAVLDDMGYQLIASNNNHNFVIRRLYGAVGKVRFKVTFRDVPANKKETTRYHGDSIDDALTAYNELG